MMPAIIGASPSEAAAGRRPSAFWKNSETT